MEEKMEPQEPEKNGSGGSNYWMGVVIVVVVVVGIIWYAGGRKKSEVFPAPAAENNQTENQPTESEDQKEPAAVVELTDSGFSPQSVSIKVGETVKFTNASSGGMWVASAPHPTHTDYLEFDAKKAYQKGESYSFTFEKSGTWKFHNHVDATKFGSVVVE